MTFEIYTPNNFFPVQYESELDKVPYIVRQAVDAALKQIPSHIAIMGVTFPKYELSSKVPDASAARIETIDGDIHISVRLVVNARVVSKDPDHKVDATLSRANLPLREVSTWRNECFTALHTMFPMRYPIKVNLTQATCIAETPFSWLYIEF